MSLALEVQNASSEGEVPDQTMFASWVQAALGQCHSASSISLRIVDEAESAALNQQYRKKQGATNVLSFPFDNPPGVQEDILGDVVICAPVVRREAQQQGKPELAHWAHIVVHGIMHLQGYDHMNDTDAKRMESEETRVLAQLGFADPYS